MLLFTLLVSTLPLTSQAAPDDFVRRTGTQLTLHNQPFRFSGPNIYWLGLDEAYGTDYPSSYRVNDALDTVVAMGGTVVRAHTLGVSVGCDKCLMPTQGQWNADAWQHIDYAVYAASQRNLKLIIPLTDEHRFYHGSRHTFTAWRGLDDGEFWTNPQVIGDFTQYIGGILNHVNQFTGVRYRDDPTIMAWETGNELNAPASWTAIIARYLKQLDTKHLIIDGNYGLNTNSLAIPEVDIVSDHFYPLRPDKLRTDAQQAQRAGKAFYAGEYGWDQGDLASFLQTIEQTPTIGDSFWSLFPHADNGGFVSHSDGHTLHYPGDDATMQAAVKLLRDHAYAMRGVAAPNVALVPIETNHNPAWPPVIPTPTPEAPPVWTPEPGTSNVAQPTTPTGTFVIGVNIGGDAVTINGQRWLSLADAQARGMNMQGGTLDRKSINPQPSTDNDTRAMLNTLVYAPDNNLDITLPLPDGNYSVYLWALENFGSNTRSWNLNLEGQTAARDLGLLPLDTWTNYGPYSVMVRGGVLDMTLVRGSGSPMISGFAVYQRAGDSAPETTPTTPATPTPSNATPTPTPWMPRRSDRVA